MTTLTIIKSDKSVSVDGRGISNIDCSSLASNVHAIQFDGSNGFEEYNDGTENKAITSISAYSAITDLYNTAKTAEDNAKATEDENNATYAASYTYKREIAYAEIKEQLDQLYHDMTAGKLDATGEWHKAIKAVKDANPKP
jgi:hypothetical protein